jgi:hypothetical protein
MATVSEISDRNPVTVEEHLLRMMEIWPNMPSPEHHPIVFQFYLKMYKHQLGRG